MTTLTVDLEKIACDIALALSVDGLALSPDARDRVQEAPTSLLPIDVEANLLLSVRDGEIPFGRSDDDGLPGRRGPKLLR